MIAWLFNTDGTEPGHERALNNLQYYREMILEEESELQRSRQVIVPNPQLKNEIFLEGVRASPDFNVYEQLCRGEELPRTVCPSFLLVKAFIILTSYF